MAQPIRIIAGFISDEARQLLTAHNVPLEQFQYLTIVSLTRESGAGLSRSIRPLEYVISFYINEHDVAEDCCMLFLAPDAGETKIIFRPNYWSVFEREEGPVV